MAKRKYTDHHINEILQAKLFSLMRDVDKHVIRLSRLENDGRRRKTIIKDLVDDGYLVPNEDPKAEMGELTGKAYHELKQEEPDIMSAWMVAVGIDPTDICPAEVYDNYRCSDKMGQVRAGVVIRPKASDSYNRRMTKCAAITGELSKPEEIKWIIEQTRVKSDHGLQFTRIKRWKDPVTLEKPEIEYSDSVCCVRTDKVEAFINDLFIRGDQDVSYSINLEWGLEHVLGLNEDEAKQFTDSGEPSFLRSSSNDNSRTRLKQIAEFYETAKKKRDSIRNEIVSLTHKLELMTKGLTMVDCKYESVESFLFAYKNRLIEQVAKQEARKEEEAKQEEEAAQ